MQKSSSLPKIKSVVQFRIILNILDLNVQIASIWFVCICSPQVLQAVFYFTEESKVVVIFLMQLLNFIYVLSFALVLWKIIM